jgi:hypothetical protein
MATPLDPNVLALNMQLQLDTQDARVSLDGMLEQARSIEQSLGRDLSDPLKQVSISFNHVQKSAQLIADNSGVMTSNIGLLNGNLVDNLKMVTQLDDFGKDDSKRREKYMDSIREEKEIRDGMRDYAENDNDQFRLMPKLTDKVTSAIETKNQRHMEQNRLLSLSNAAIGDMGEGMRDVALDAYKVVLVIGSITTGLRLMYHWVAMADQQTEQFKESTYRAVGSQQALVQETRILQAEFGLAAEAAAQMYRQLIDLNLPKAELKTYAKSIAAANRHMGLATDTLTAYAFRLRQAGIGSGQFSHQIDQLSVAMYKYGLSAQDVTKIMSQQKAGAMRLALMFGDVNAAAKLDRDVAAPLIGLGKQFGIATEQITEFLGTLQDPVALLRFSMISGVVIKNTDDIGRAMLGVGKRLRATERDYDALMASAQNGEQVGLIWADATAKAYGMSTEVFLLTGRMSKLADQMGLTGDEAGALAKIAERMRYEGWDPWVKSNNTITAQLRILDEAWGSIKDTLKSAIGGVLLPLLKVFTFFVVIVARVVTWIGSLVQAFDDWLDVSNAFTVAAGVVAYALNAVGQAVQWVWSGVTKAAAEFWEFIKPVREFADACLGWIPIVGIISTIWQTLKFLVGVLLAATVAHYAYNLAMWTHAQTVKLWTAATTSATAATTAYSGAAGTASVHTSTFGRTLIAFGKAMRSISVSHLLGFSAVILSIAAATYAFAQAASLFKDASWQMFAGAAVLVGAMFAVVTALGSLAVIATPLQPIMWPLVGLFIALGAAAVLFGYAAQLMAAAISTSADAFGRLLTMMATTSAAAWSTAGALVAISAATGMLVTAGLLAFAAVPGLTALALGITILGAASYAFGDDIAIAGMGLQSLGAGLVVVGAAMATFNEGMAAASFWDIGKFAVSVGELGAAGATAGPALAVLGFGLGAAAAGTIALATAIAGGTIDTITNFASRLPAIGLDLMVGGIAVATGSSYLTDGAMALWASGLLLDLSATYVAAGAAGIASAGELILTGGTSLYSGVASAVAAARMVISNQDTLLLAANAIGALATAYNYNAGLLADSGVTLTFSMGMISFAMSWFTQIIGRVYKQAPDIEKVSRSLTNIVDALRDVGTVDASKLKAVSAGFDELSTIGTAIRPFLAQEDNINKAVLLVGKLTASLGELRQAQPLNFDSISNLTAALVELQQLQPIRLELVQIADVPDFDPAITQLDYYAVAVEQAMTRIESAVRDRALPALNALRRPDFAGLARAETINTVKVLDQRDGDSGTDDPYIKAMQRHTDTLDAIKELLTRITDDQTALAVLALLGDAVTELRRNSGSDLAGLMGGLNS